LSGAAGSWRSDAASRSLVSRANPDGKKRGKETGVPNVWHLTPRVFPKDLQRIFRFGAQSAGGEFPGVLMCLSREDHAGS
jgi:hypothetical protein